MSRYAALNQHTGMTAMQSSASYESPLDVGVAHAASSYSCHVPVRFDTYVSAHYWSYLSEFDTYEAFPNGPIWIDEVSQYAYGIGTVPLLMCAESPHDDLAGKLYYVYYVPGLLDHLHRPMRLFSYTAARRLKPNLRAIGLHERLNPQNRYLDLPNGLRIPLHFAFGYFYINCRPKLLHKYSMLPSLRSRFSKAVTSSSISPLMLGTTLEKTRFEFRHLDVHISSSTFQPVVGQRIYSTRMSIVDQVLQPVDSLESLTPMPTSAVDKGESKSSLSVSFPYKYVVPRASSEPAVIPPIGSTQNMLDTQIIMRSTPLTSMDPMSPYASFHTLFGPHLAHINPSTTHHPIGPIPEPTTAFSVDVSPAKHMPTPRRLLSCNHVSFTPMAHLHRRWLVPPEPPYPTIASFKFQPSAKVCSKPHRQNDILNLLITRRQHSTINYLKSSHDKLSNAAFGAQCDAVLVCYDHIKWPEFRDFVGVIFYTQPFTLFRLLFMQLRYGCTLQFR